MNAMPDKVAEGRAAPFARQQPFRAVLTQRT